MSLTSMSIYILGEELTLSIKEEDRDEFKNSLEKYRSIVEKIYEKHPNQSNLKISILAALVITAELNSLQKEIKNLEENSDNYKILTNAIKDLENSINMWYS